jgi:hypothetical protein
MGSVRLPVGSLGHCVALLATGALANGTVQAGLGVGPDDIGCVAAPPLGLPALVESDPPLAPPLGPGVGSLMVGAAGSSVRLQAHPRVSQANVRKRGSLPRIAREVLALARPFSERIYK